MMSEFEHTSEKSDNVSRSAMKMNINLTLITMKMDLQKNCHINLLARLRISFAINSFIIIKNNIEYEPKTCKVTHPYQINEG